MVVVNKYVCIHNGLQIIVGSDTEIIAGSTEMLDLQNMQSETEIVDAGYVVLYPVPPTVNTL